MQALNSTQLLLLGGVFVLVFAAAFGAMLVFAPRSMERRLAQAGAAPQGASSAAGVPSGTPDWIAKLAEITQPVSKLSLPKDGWENSPLRLKLMNAGWRTPHAAGIYLAAKTLLALILPTIATLVLIHTPLAQKPYGLAAMLVVLGAFGYYLPNGVLSRRVATRQRVIFEDFPDALDLLTVCVEAGLGLDAALIKVAEELRHRSKVVAGELELTLLEMRSGFTRETALRNLALRTGVEDIDSFCTMLIQAERFGTSVADSLRVLSDMLRTRRRMRAEERAAKIALKLLFPLIFCIFPALLTVLLGPAFINIYRVLLPTLTGQ
ncbi:type II secretion system F family protein [Paraburkholderia kururiensis]|uniref:Type II secretion system F family protein n=1 Tax=Paraburkholderia kururiensis TaxID=984307 RepID=A0ABZ0WPC5_9BURK|nr:type II secretion system F family protein [Paraburkholderia kururiensis]WQD79222.1 type II secretion system F family protein [Paraburkholderia kururiensis]